MWEQWGSLSSLNFPNSPIIPITPIPPTTIIKEYNYVVLEVFTRVFDIPVAVRFGQP